MDVVDRRGPPDPTAGARSPLLRYPVVEEYADPRRSREFHRPTVNTVNAVNAAVDAAVNGGSPAQLGSWREGEAARGGAAPREGAEG
eukprot:821993-Prorocentrum_minimum.AAC.1